MDLVALVYAGIVLLGVGAMIVQIGDFDKLQRRLIGKPVVIDAASQINELARIW